MRLDATQQMRLEQRMKLAPRLIQSMEILQLPVMALQERIQEELQANPVLEMAENTGEEDVEPVETDDSVERGEEPLVVDESNGNSEDFERLADFSDEFGEDFSELDGPSRRPQPPSGERDAKLEAMANTPAPQQSLNEYLLEQWRLLDTSEEISEAGELVINHIDADGYLHTPLEEIIQKGGEEGPVPLETLQKALKKVQELEPPGVGARDVRECLLLQLSAEAEAGRDVTLETELVDNFLREIEKNHLPAIARKLRRPLEEIKQAVENLSHLNPRPGLLVGGRTVPIINPDAVVEIGDDGEIHVTMSEENSPRLKISSSYRRMARNRDTDDNTRKFIRDNIRSARWLVDAIQQRRRTVRRVIEEVFKSQRDFLEQGRQALKPLPMAEVANRVGVHVATVSRAVAGKYVQTPRGIDPLRMFFSGGTTGSDGSAVAWDAVKAKLKEIIDSEDKSKPLNDDRLAEELANRGLKIARRTVAKYRKLLDIPPARRRKQY